MNQRKSAKTRQSTDSPSYQPSACKQCLVLLVSLMVLLLTPPSRGSCETLQERGEYLLRLTQHYREHGEVPSGLPGEFKSLLGSISFKELSLRGAGYSELQIKQGLVRGLDELIYRDPSLTRLKFDNLRVKSELYRTGRSYFHPWRG